MLSLRTVTALALVLPVLSVGDSYWKEYDIDRPSEIDGFTVEYRTDDSKNWSVLPEHQGGWDLGFDANQVGYRLQSEGDSSAVIYKYNGSVDPLTVHFTEGEHEVGIQFIHTISQSWASTTKAQKKRDLWDDGNYQPLVFRDRTLHAVNIECDTMLLTIEAIDANGKRQFVNGTDSVSIQVPDVFPVNATVNAPQFGTSASIIISGEEPVLVTVGDGNAPAVTAGYRLDVQLCPD